MRRILVTGMSGTGKSSALVELGKLCFQVLDTDHPAWSARFVPAATRLINSAVPVGGAVQLIRRGSSR